MTAQADGPPAPDFTPERTRVLLAAACRQAGLDPVGAELLRHQTNAVYRLATSPVIVKIARPDYGQDDIQRTVDLTRWLTSLDFPTVPLLDVDQPVITDGGVATFWQYLPQHQPIEAGDIAGPLRELHQLAPPDLPIPRLDAVAAIRYSLDRQQILNAAEHAFLRDRCQTLASELPLLQYEAAPVLIHGDPQHRNALWDAGQPVLCDWDSAVTGPAEWDLVTIEIHCRRFGHPASSYADFSRIYGRDIRDWPGYQVLKDLRELRMIATNARKSDPRSRAAAEVHRRIAQLRAEETAENWAIL